VLLLLIVETRTTTHNWKHCAALHGWDKGYCLRLKTLVVVPDRCWCCGCSWLKRKACCCSWLTQVVPLLSAKTRTVVAIVNEDEEVDAVAVMLTVSEVKLLLSSRAGESWVFSSLLLSFWNFGRVFSWCDYFSIRVDFYLKNN